MRYWYTGPGGECESRRIYVCVSRGDIGRAKLDVRCSHKTAIDVHIKNECYLSK